MANASAGAGTKRLELKFTPSELLNLQGRQASVDVEREGPRGRCALTVVDTEELHGLDYEIPECYLDEDKYPFLWYKWNEV
jgi:hypothetical protein